MLFLSTITFRQVCSWSRHRGVERMAPLHFLDSYYLHSLFVNPVF